MWVVLTFGTYSAICNIINLKVYLEYLRKHIQLNWKYFVKSESTLIRLLIFTKQMNNIIMLLLILMRWLSSSALEDFLDIWLNIGQIQSKIGTCAKWNSVFFFNWRDNENPFSHREDVENCMTIFNASDNSGNSLLTEGEIQNGDKPRARNCILSSLSLLLFHHLSSAAYVLMQEWSRKRDSLRSLPPINSESPDVELTSVTN
jgi:hypothetical protein